MREKYVVTRGDQPLAWENSHRSKTIDAVTALKQEEGPDLMIWGSSTIYPALLAAGLLDRLMLMIYPVTLGRESACSVTARRLARSR